MDFRKTFNVDLLIVAAVISSAWQGRERLTSVLPLAEDLEKSRRNGNSIEQELFVEMIQGLILLCSFLARVVTH
jgi:hypothetical protein